MSAEGFSSVSGPAAFAPRRTGLGTWSLGEEGSGVWRGLAGQRESQLGRAEVVGEGFEKVQRL